MCIYIYIYNDTKGVDGESLGGEAALAPPVARGLTMITMIIIMIINSLIISSDNDIIQYIYI